VRAYLAMMRPGVRFAPATPGRAGTATAWLLLLPCGDAEVVDRRAGLHGGEPFGRTWPGWRRGLGRNVAGDRNRVVTAGELVVEEDERVALGVRRDKCGPPVDGHLDRWRVCEGQPDRMVAGRVGGCPGGILVAGVERLLYLAGDQAWDAGQRGVEEGDLRVDEGDLLFEFGLAVRGDEVAQRDQVNIGDIEPSGDAASPSTSMGHPAAPQPGTSRALPWRVQCGPASAPGDNDAVLPRSQAEF